MAKYIITGGAGFIGSHLAERLIGKKSKVIILDNLSTGHRKLVNKKAKFIFADIKNENLIKKILKNYNIDSVIHLAAVLSVGESEKNPLKYKKIKVDGTKKFLSSLKNSNASFLQIQ